MWPEKIRFPLLSKSSVVFMGFTLIGVKASDSPTSFGTVSIIRPNKLTQVFRKPSPCSPSAIMVILLSLS